MESYKREFKIRSRKRPNTDREVKNGKKTEGGRKKEGPFMSRFTRNAERIEWPASSHHRESGKSKEERFPKIRRGAGSKGPGSDGRGHIKAICLLDQKRPTLAKTRIVKTERGEGKKGSHEKNSSSTQKGARERDELQKSRNGI